jgi:hypothetical protein
MLPALLAMLMLPAAALAQGFEARVDANFVAGIGSGLMIVIIAVTALMIISMWKIFDKAGKPGWASIIPIYNLVVMVQIAGKPDWWILLMFVPFVNIIVGIMIVVGMAEKFGKGTGFALGMIFLPLFFYPILAFDGSVYEGRDIEGRMQDTGYRI